MHLAQENFERAVHSARQTLAQLSAIAAGTEFPPVLAELPARKLNALAWDLEAIQATLRLELMNREPGSPTDFG